MSRLSSVGRAVDWLLSCLGVGGVMVVALVVAALAGWYGRGLFILLSN